MSEEMPTIIDAPARLITVAKRSGAPDVQMFDADAVNKAIDKQMSQLPPGKTVAAIAYVDRDGANVAIVGRISKLPGDASWTVLGTRRWSGDWQASAAFRWAI
jgi:hypothetical protein